MNENDLELLVSQFLEGMRRAFREVGRRGAADHSTVMEYLNRGIVGADKIKREELSRNEAIAEAIDLDQKIEDVIEKLSEAGIPDRDAVIRRIKTSSTAKDAIARNAPLLIEQGLAAKVSSKLTQKKREPTPSEEERKQYQLFRESPEFVGVPASLVYVDPDTGKPVKKWLSEALERDWVQAIAQSKRNTEALYKANAVLEPLRRKHGDIPGPQLWAKKLKEDRRRQA